MALVFAFPKLLSVICYLKRKTFLETVKLSTVTLGDGVIDLSCDIIKTQNCINKGIYRFAN